MRKRVVENARCVPVSRHELILFPGLDGTGDLFAPLLRLIDGQFPQNITLRPVAGPHLLLQAQPHAAWTTIQDFLLTPAPEPQIIAG